MGQLRFRDDLTYFLDAYTVGNLSAEDPPSGDQSNDVEAVAGFFVDHSARATRDPSGCDGVGRHSSFKFDVRAVCCGSWELHTPNPDIFLGDFEFRRNYRFSYI